MLKVSFSVNEGNLDAVKKRFEVSAFAESVGLSICERDPEIVIAIGGDGTILQAVHQFHDIPVLGLNLGGLGYLACVGGADSCTAISMLAKGRYAISERRMLRVVKNGRDDLARHAALNDIVVMREMSGHSTRLDLEADGKVVTRYMADGLIFATPTGSTAYSLAAGGPVLMPDSDSLVVTPMNPHALGVRPLVTKDNVRFKVTAMSRTVGNTMKVGVYADGKSILTMEEGESVEIVKSERTAKLVELEGYDPYDVLARKLGWSGSNVK